MNAQICLEKLKLCGVLSFATVDKNGAPQIRCISAIHYEPDSLYFFTARGKAFCDELLTDGRVQILAYTRFKEMIRLSGKAVPAQNQEEKIHTIFAEQPYLANVYPGETRNIGIIFELRDFTIEYFNLGVKPIFRESYAVGQAETEKKRLSNHRCLHRLRHLPEPLPAEVHCSRRVIHHPAGELSALRGVL